MSAALADMTVVRQGLPRSRRFGASSCCHPAVTESGNCADGTLIRRVGVDDVTNFSHEMPQLHFRDVHITPDGSYQLIVAYRAIAMLNQIDDAVEDLWGHVYEDGRTSQLARCAIESVFAEPICGRASRNFHSITPTT
jgi:hypothetical protein